MQIFVKTLTGKTISLQFRPSETVLAVKQRLEATEGIPVGQQRLIFARAGLTRPLSLDDYAVHDGWAGLDAARARAPSAPISPS